MNSIKDVEFEKLVETTELLSGKFLFQKMDENVDSYFVDVEEIHSLNHEIKQYDDIGTPIAMRGVLTDMWSDDMDSHMQSYATILSVAAFKNKNVDEVEEREISPYIYEF